jgi:hypothetical protein
LNSALLLLYTTFNNVKNSRVTQGNSLLSASQHRAGYRCAPRLDVPSFHATSTSVLDWRQALSVDLLVFVIQVNRNAISTCVANLAPADLPAEDNKFCTAGICTAHSRNGEPLICLNVWEVPHVFLAALYCCVIVETCYLSQEPPVGIFSINTVCIYGR